MVRRQGRWGHGPFRGVSVKRIKEFLANRKGATAIEYGLIAALIAVAVIGGVSTLGSNANKTFVKVSSKMG